MTDCERIRELGGAYVLGAATRDEVVEVATHISKCEPCAGDVASLKQIAALLPLAAPQTEPPPTLGGRLLSAAKDDAAHSILRHRSAVPRGVAKDPWATFGRPATSRAAAWEHRWWVAAAAALLIIIGGTVATMMYQRDAARNSMTQMQTELASMHRATARLQRQTANGNLVMVALAAGKYWQLRPSREYGDWKCAIVQPPKGSSAMLLGTFPKAPHGKAYEVWVMRGSEVHSAGMVHQAGIVVMDMRMIVRNGDVVAFTVEPEKGSAAPTSPMLMATTL